MGSDEENSHKGRLSPERCCAKRDTEGLPALPAALPETGLRVYTSDSRVRNYLLFPRCAFRATWLSCFNTCLSKHDS